MTTQEIKTAIIYSSILGTKSANEGLSRVPHHNDEFRNYLLTLPIQEMSIENMRISTMITKSFADNYTMQLLNIAR